jgi:hypothetical protein
VKGKAGMGNRLLSLTHAVVYALITKRTMIVDWSDYTYSHSGEDVFDEFFVLNGVAQSRESLSGLTSLTISPPEWRGHLDLSVRANKKRARRANRWRRRIPGLSVLSPRRTDWNLPDKNPVDVECPADVRVMWAYNHQIQLFSDQHKRALFGTESAAEIVQVVLREYLRPTSEIQARADDFVARHQPMIGVHVRHSDMRMDAPISRCFDRIDTLRDDCHLFVATDNSDVLIEFEQRYGQRVVASDKWYPAPDAAAHQNENCPDRTENGKAALLDMLVLARCETLLRHEGSTFSRVAGYFSGRPCPAWNV